MKTKLIYTVAFFSILFASCSSERYSYLSKVKVPKAENRTVGISKSNLIKQNEIGNLISTKANHEDLNFTEPSELITASNFETSLVLNAEPNKTGPIGRISTFTQTKKSVNNIIKVSKNNQNDLSKNEIKQSSENKGIKAIGWVLIILGLLILLLVSIVLGLLMMLVGLLFVLLGGKAG